MLTITTTHQPATDLGYLLHKHPEKLQTFEMPFGNTHVFYPEAAEERCTAAMVLEMDPIRLTRRGGQGGSTPDHLIQEYVNDRPYAATSHLSTAIAKVFGTALSGRCDAMPELAQTPIPLEIRAASVRSHHGPDLIRRLFEPLDYEVETETPPLDPLFPEWGEGRHHNLTLKSESHTLRETLVHLYVLLPALDNEKHYWIGKDEVEKLLRFGQDWLPKHPEQALISRRYLGHNRSLTDQADELMTAAAAAENGSDEEEPEPETQAETEAVQEQPQREGDLEQPLRLGELRTAAVLEALRATGAGSVLDLGCGEGQLLTHLAQEGQFKSITAVEVSQRSLRIASRRLRNKSITPAQRSKVKILHGSLVYQDPRLRGYQAAAAMEVVEHIDPSRLDAFQETVLGDAQPETLVMTTPNREYNVLFESMDKPLRHRDHRFEWTRQEFQDWARDAAGRHGYDVEFRGIGEEHPALGHPTQMAVFSKKR